MGKYTREEKAREIKKELEKLKGLYKELDVKQIKLMDGLVNRAAYMKVTLEEYEHEIDENGYVEMFTQSQSTDPYERERPVARLYNTMNKNYQSIVKQLTDLLPKIENKQESDGFDSFCDG